MGTWQEWLSHFTWPRRRVCSLKRARGCSQTEKERQCSDSKYLNTFFPCRLVPFSSAHQMNALTSPPNHLLHSQGHCQSSPSYKGQRKETFAASSLVFLCCVFCQNTGLKLSHTQPAKGVKLPLYWHWFQYHPTNTSRCQLLDHFQILKANIQGSEYFYHLQDWSDKLFLHYLRMPMHVLSGQSSVSANPINPVILFILHSWYFIILIFKCDLNPSRI